MAPIPPCLSSPAIPNSFVPSLTKKMVPAASSLLRTPTFPLLLHRIPEISKSSLLPFHPLNRPLRLSAVKPISCTLRPHPQPQPQSQPHPLAALLSRALRSIARPLAAAILVAAILADPLSALAASGGRMGGRSFSAPSRSYSAPSSPSFSYSVPYYAPSPFGFGGGAYFGPVFGFGGGSGFFTMLMGFAAVALISNFLQDRGDDGSILTASQKTTVLKLQVGLLGIARSFQKDLDRIAEVADTSTPEGLNYILTETTLALLRHPDCCISGYTLADVKRNMEDGEKCFNKLSIEERGKFDEETLVNVNNIRRHSSSTQRLRGISNEYIVITILVAAEGTHKLPVINSSSDLKEALQKLGSISSSKTLAVEVLWTPQNENDTLTERELLADYPLLRPL